MSSLTLQGSAGEMRHFANKASSSSGGGVKQCSALLSLLRESIKALSLIEDARESEKGLHDLAYLARATIQVSNRGI